MSSCSVCELEWVGRHGLSWGQVTMGRKGCSPLRSPATPPPGRVEREGVSGRELPGQGRAVAFSYKDCILGGEEVN